MANLQVPKSFLSARASVSVSAHQKLSVAKYQHQVTADTVPLERTLETNSVDNLQRSIETFEAEKEMARISELDYATWLPFCAPVYKISPRIEDYILVRTIICPSDLPNRNGIAFPRSELVRFQPPPINRLSYKAWVGCPIHEEHSNEDCSTAHGVIFDASFNKVQGYGNGKLWKVMGLLGIDKNKYPDIAQQVLDGTINTYSMGALVDSFTCGYCGTVCSKDRRCSHTSGTDNVNWKRYQDYDGSSHLAFLNAHGISPIECSIVRDPAWASALSDWVEYPWTSEVKADLDVPGSSKPQQFL